MGKNNLNNIYHLNQVAAGICFPVVFCANLLVLLQIIDGFFLDRNYVKKKMRKRVWIVVRIVLK